MDRGSLLSRYPGLLNQIYSPHDAGLGCTVRSFQTLLSSALLHHLSRDQICTSFESPRGILSFHNLTNGAPPRWLGPHALISGLPLDSLNSSLPVHIIPCPSATIFAGDVKASFSPPPIFPISSSSSTLLLIPLRLSPGETLSAFDIETLKGALMDPSFAGMLGGPPSHCTCVLGLNIDDPAGGEVVVLDPHKIKPPNLPPTALLPYLSPPTPPLVYSLHCLSTTLLLAFQFFTLGDFEGFSSRHFPLGPATLSPTLPFLSLMPGKEAEGFVIPDLDFPPAVGSPLGCVEDEYVEVSERCYWEEVVEGEEGEEGGSNTATDAGSSGSGSAGSSGTESRTVPPLSPPPPPPPPRLNFRVRLTTLAWSVYALFVRLTAAPPV